MFPSPHKAILRIDGLAELLEAAFGQNALMR
jgi:hypothetical protein